MTIGLAVVAGLLAVLLVTGILLLLYTWRTTRRIEAAMPPTGRFVAVPGARLHVAELGHGPAVLLVHGLSGQLGHFTGVRARIRLTPQVCFRSPPHGDFNRF